MHGCVFGPQERNHCDSYRCPKSGRCQQQTGHLACISSLFPHTLLETVGRGTQRKQNSESRYTIQAEALAEPPGHRTTRAAGGPTLSLGCDRWSLGSCSSWRWHLVWLESPYLLGLAAHFHPNPLPTQCSAADTDMESV